MPLIFKNFFLIFLILFMSVIYSAFSYADKPVKLNDRMLVFNALKKQDVFNKYRKLVHLSHVCNLVIDNSLYPVINVQEDVKGAQVAHSVNNILILDSFLEMVKKINYDGASGPLYCDGNKLFVYGSINIDGLVPEGNVLSFSNKGKKVVISAMEANDFPRQSIPQ